MALEPKASVIHHWGEESVALVASRAMYYMDFPHQFADAEIDLEFNAIYERPEIARMMSTCIALWSRADVRNAILYAALCGTDSAAVRSIYLNCRSYDKISKLMEAANYSLKGPENFIASNIIKRSEILSREINSIIHGAWATCNRFPDKLVWTLREEFAQIEFIDICSEDDDNKPDFRRMLKYSRLYDFESMNKMRQHISFHMVYISALIEFCYERDSGVRNKRVQELAQLPPLP